MTYHWQSGGDLQNVIQAQAEMYLYTSYCSYSPRFPLSTSALQFMWSSTPPYLGIYVLKKKDVSLSSPHSNIFPIHEAQQLLLSCIN